MRYLALALAVTALAPATAKASFDFGGTAGVPGMSGTPESCTQRNHFYWQHTNADSYWTVPFDGVIVGWLTDPGGASGFSERLVVVREGSPNVLVGASAYEASPMGFTMYPTRIKVQEGDLLGLESPDSNSFPCAYTTSASTDTVRTASDPGFGSVTTLSPGLAVNAGARIEPDADGDGYGDETQDRCPTDAGTSGQCRAEPAITLTANPPSIPLGGTTTLTIQVRNNGSVEARLVRVRSMLSRLLTVVSGCSRTCFLGSLAGHAARTLTVVARGTSPGDAFSSATVATTTPDAENTNNSATVKVTVVPPAFRGMSVTKRSLRVSQGFVTVTVFCPADTMGSCTGSFVIRTAKRVALPSRHRYRAVLKLGSGRFTVLPGQSAHVRTKITRFGRKLLAHRRTVKAMGTFTAHDRANQTKVTKLQLKLRRHR